MVSNSVALSTPSASGHVGCLIMILNIFSSLCNDFLHPLDFCFRYDRNIPLSKETSPVTVDELHELLKLLAKYISTQKGANLQNMIPDTHALLVKWNKFNFHSTLFLGTDTAELESIPSVVIFAGH